MVQLFLSGTAYRHVMEAKEPSVYSFMFIDNPLLTLHAVFALVRHYAIKAEAHEYQWVLCRPFVQLLIDMGGLPRAVSCLFGVCFGPSVQDFFATLNQVSWQAIFTTVATTIDQMYVIKGFISAHHEAAQQILHCALVNIPIMRDTILFNLPVSDMELQGHIFLVNSGNNNLLLHMPILFIYIYNQQLHILPAALELAFNYNITINWQD